MKPGINASTSTVRSPASRRAHQSSLREGRQILDGTRNTFDGRKLQTRRPDMHRNRSERVAVAPLGVAENPDWTALSAGVSARSWSTPIERRRANPSAGGHRAAHAA